MIARPVAIFDGHGRGSIGMEATRLAGVRRGWCGGTIGGLSERGGVGKCGTGGNGGGASEPGRFCRKRRGGS
jgi:hypothetical protein